MATVPQGCPCPSMGHPQLQSLRPIVGQCGSPMATVHQGCPYPRMLKKELGCKNNLLRDDNGGSGSMVFG